MYQIDLILFYIQDASKFTVQMESETRNSSFSGIQEFLYSKSCCSSKEMYLFSRESNTREEAVYLGGATVSRKDNKAISGSFVKLSLGRYISILFGRYGDTPLHMERPLNGASVDALNDDACRTAIRGIFFDATVPSLVNEHSSSYCCR